MLIKDTVLEELVINKHEIEGLKERVEVLEKEIEDLSGKQSPKGRNRFVDQM